MSISGSEATYLAYRQVPYEAFCHEVSDGTFGRPRADEITHRVVRAENLSTEHGRQMPRRLTSILTTTTSQPTSLTNHIATSSRPDIATTRVARARRFRKTHNRRRQTSRVTGAAALFLLSLGGRRATASIARLCGLRISSLLIAHFGTTSSVSD